MSYKHEMQFFSVQKNFKVCLTKLYDEIGKKEKTRYR
jgi:hypothetical protein